MKKLYVGNLPYTVRDEELREFFSAYSSVTSASVVMDRMTGRSRGFGFVEMSDDAEADEAVGAMNGKDTGGRALVVNEARPKSDDDRRGGGDRPYRR